MMVQMKSNLPASQQFVRSQLIANKYPAFAINNSEDEFYAIMQFVENLYPKVSIIVCQRTDSPSLQYVSTNCKKIIGYDTLEIKRMKLSDFLALVHPEDIGELERCFAFINNLEPYDPLLYRFEIYYRLKHKKGHYINVVEEKLAMMSKEKKYIYLNLLRDVTLTAKFHDVKMNVYREVGEKLLHIKTYIPRTTKNDFTPRQKDIINLIGRGYTNQEIAEEMSISINTVKNHKSLLFRKVRVKSTVELISITKNLFSN
jgi:DNA-binding CsgD family transcriptional regulator